MNNEQVTSLPGKDNPVLCSDGNLGMLLIYPGADGLCGVQVHGEEEHRWIPAALLHASEGGALREDEAPKAPPASAQQDFAQMLLAMDWTQRGGMSIAA